MNRRLKQIQKRLGKCEEQVGTYHDPWLAVDDIKYLLRRVQRLEAIVALSKLKEALK